MHNNISLYFTPNFILDLKAYDGMWAAIQTIIHFCASGFQMGGDSGANGCLPAMISAAFSASMIVGAFKLPLTIDGITLASTT